jgi:hypothetical protein
MERAADLAGVVFELRSQRLTIQEMTQVMNARSRSAARNPVAEPPTHTSTRTAAQAGVLPRLLIHEAESNEVGHLGPMRYAGCVRTVNIDESRGPECQVEPLFPTLQYGHGSALPQKNAPCEHHRKNTENREDRDEITLDRCLPLHSE